MQLSCSSCYFFKKVIQIFEYYSEHISQSSSNFERSLMIFKLNWTIMPIEISIWFMILSSNWWSSNDFNDFITTSINLCELQKKLIMKTLGRLNLYNSLHYIFLLIKHCNFCVIVERCKWRNREICIRLKFQNLYITSCSGG